jgi:ribonuclease Z
MSHRFDPVLVNDPFDDPGVYVDLVFERRALLFDLGDLGRLAPRKLLRVSDVFVTHRHMDHFAGFDQLLRRLLGRDKVLGLYGPTGLVEAVEHKLKAYSWNLIEGYAGNLVFRVTELDEAGCLASAEFIGRRRFERREIGKRESNEGALLAEPGLRVRATTIDHGVPALAFALEERARIDILRDRVEALGLTVGPWLHGFKKAVLGGLPDDTQVDVTWCERQSERPPSLPLGMLEKEIMKIGSGRKIAYVVDCCFTDSNIEKVVRLAQGSDILFIEAMFREVDAALAAARHHLTAWQAGTLARISGAKRLVTLHYSPRYKGQGCRLAEEALDAFRGPEGSERSHPTNRLE